MIKPLKAVTIGKIEFVEAWIRSAHIAGVLPQTSAIQLQTFEKIVGLSFTDEVENVCNRLLDNPAR